MPMHYCRQFLHRFQLKFLPPRIVPIIWKLLRFLVTVNHGFCEIPPFFTVFVFRKENHGKLRFWENDPTVFFCHEKSRFFFLFFPGPIYRYQIWSNCWICIKLARVIWLTSLKLAWLAMIEYIQYNIIDFFRSYFRRICTNVLHFILCYGCFVSSHIKFPHMKTWQNTCDNKFSSAYIYGNFQWADKFAQIFVIFTPRIFLCSPNFNLF